MKIFVAIDDTESLEMGSTGRSANDLRKLIRDRGWKGTEAVARYQLLLHPDIPYTSHNSSMCFIADMIPLQKQGILPRKVFTGPTGGRERPSKVVTYSGREAHRERTSQPLAASLEAQLATEAFKRRQAR